MDQKYQVTVQEVQRRLQLKKINIFNIVRTMKYFRNILSILLEVVYETVTFQSNTSIAVVELSKITLSQAEMIKDLAERLNKIEGGEEL